MKEFLGKVVRAFWRREVLLYLVFGVLTTLVNLGLYFVCTYVFLIDDVVSNGLAWVGSVAFAFVTNKLWVFESRSFEGRKVLREAASFVGFRGVSGVIDVGLFALCVRVFLWNDLLVKLGLQVLIVILNYVFSKIFVFKKQQS